MRWFGRLAIAAVVLFVALQCIRPGIPSPPATAEIQAPVEIKQILDKGCYSCHSDQRRLAWFDEIVPAYWLVRHDVLTARQHLNFSTLGSKPAAVQKATLYEAVNMIQLGAMPLPSFAKLHPEARLTPEDLATLKAYLNPWPPAPDHAETAPVPRREEIPVSPAGPAPARISLSSVRPEGNGLPFEPDFENWKLISTTERGDNHTLRFILGNEIAIRAAQSGNISPWPDGASFAKIAWTQEHGPDGLIYPGKFVQVEFMIKDASRYRETAGWGWGRWRGLDLQPYGTGAGFVDECSGCHRPVRGDDNVYTLPITLARGRSGESVNNRAASLPDGLPWQPLQWNPVTMLVDPAHLTTSTLYANQAVSRAIYPPETPAYAEGTILALVTWAQRADPHWFGARIPDRPESVEFVQVGRNAQPGGYRRFDGPALTEARPPADTAAQRTQFILNLPPAPLP